MFLVGWGGRVESARVNSYFQELGRTVFDRWKQANFSLEVFPAIARAALDERPPCEHVSLEELVRDFLLNDDQPHQTQSGFGEPELVTYECPRFYIQVLFWLDGTTDIHQHEFSGAFHVMAGSSIHAEFAFENMRPITPHFRVGDLRLQQIELLETGRTVPITSGSGGIHSLFHLDKPSVTVVVRTQNDPGTAPQFTYLPPHVALDPVYCDALTMRRKQALDVLEQTGDPDYARLIREMIDEHDLEAGFYILQNGMRHLMDLDEWEPALETFQNKHGAPAAGIVASMVECQRRDHIRDMRGAITDPDHRFFLALLMNAPSRSALLALVAQRFPGDDPVDTVMAWIEELAEPYDSGTVVMDLLVPDDLNPFLAALRQMLAPGGVRRAARISAKKIQQTRTLIEGSCLRRLLDY